MGDIYADQVVVLANFNGADAATTYTAEIGGAVTFHQLPTIFFNTQYPARNIQGRSARKSRIDLLVNWEFLACEAVARHLTGQIGAKARWLLDIQGYLLNV